MKKQGILTVISGFSGAGKGTVVKQLLETYPDEYCLSISATTRKPRENEEHGVHYFFISKEEFDMLDRLYQVTQAREKWDLIFVILPKSNYVDDGFRDMTMADSQTRDWFTKHLLDLLSPFKDKIVM